MRLPRALVIERQALMRISFSAAIPLQKDTEKAGRKPLRTPGHATLNLGGVWSFVTDMSTNDYM
jgi:hypothetical protein